ncbi:MAG TPA: HAMP domain-containing sensor histidine kinase [Candidatus Baltobacteraceae bacterium]|nr:HAMP domain-containing sensor histidine kinase [Candidatus Baltobacteraceae bacterium]
MIAFKKYWQIIYAVILIVLVPILIVVNTLYAVRGFKEDTDVALQRQALIVGRLFNVAAQESLDDAAKLQALVEDVAAQVGEVRALEVLVPDGEALPSERFRIVASLDRDAVGKSSSQVQNVLAWTQDEAFAFLTRSDNATSADDELARTSGKRYWGVIMPLVDAAGQKRALVFMKLSLETLDARVASTLFRSYLLLALTVLLTVLILASNTRLFQYALLFRKLKEVDKMKDEFISMASHELMTPISAIKGFLSLFLENAFGPFQGVAREKMATLYTLSERLGDLVEDLLNVSRIEQGRLSIDPVPCQPEDLVRGVMEELETNAKNKGLAFAFESPPAPLPKIAVDPARMKQVLVNIIGNAIKYTPKGSVTVSAFLDDGKVKIKCTDTGLGMSPQARTRLFEKFYRIATDETRTIPGTGLGLWITKQLVELQHGQIYVDSIEGVGTQMSIVFPAIDAK